ncbi:MAG: HAMP domain-containing histidine kinase [Phycisphaerae bacterium]|nr:HAMP domain-containing histidine kinase [Phycisphaerae bacterium]
MPSFRATTESFRSGRELLPVLGVLLLAVILPTVCVLWFMEAATSNERLAMRQKLQDAYQSKLDAVASACDGYWPILADAIDGMSSSLADLTPPGMFSTLVETLGIDGVVIYDGQQRVAYPSPDLSRSEAQRQEDAAWQKARELEYVRSDPLAAAKAYGEIAERAEGVDAVAQAMLAQARCLATSGRAAEAIPILIRTLPRAKYEGARDQHGRLIAPDAMLRGIELIGDAGSADSQAVARDLVERVGTYVDSQMPSGQRRFLMRQLREILPDCPNWPTLDAEELTARYLESEPTLPPAGNLRPTGLPGIWRIATPSGRVVILCRGAWIKTHLMEQTAFVDWLLDSPSAGLTLLPPEDANEADSCLISQAIGSRMPGWSVGLYLKGPDPFASEAERQITVYYWTGTLMVVGISMLAGLIGWRFARQIRLTRLKNDLIATVSHELKTPLASMRVLADTLLAGNIRDEGQAREYVELIAKENARLSRLIDNFLTFSRMERNKGSFEFQEVDVSEIVAEAVEAVRERFNTPDCRLNVDVAQNLPTVVGDKDALITVVLNLLDNAQKYTEDRKEISLRAFLDGSEVCLEVRDNGIGMSGRATRKVFDRFYQVDQHLSRTAGGCGLGLSIVKFIVDAHGGRIDVRSQLGHGSTFSVRLPVRHPNGAR